MVSASVLCYSGLLFGGGDRCPECKSIFGSAIEMDHDDALPSGPLPGTESLVEILPSIKCKPKSWTTQVLLSIEDAFDLIETPELVCSSAEKILWDRNIVDPQTGLKMNIEGLALDGSLNVSRGAYKSSWRRW